MSGISNSTRNISNRMSVGATTSSRRYINSNNSSSSTTAGSPHSPTSSSQQQQQKRKRALLMLPVLVCTTAALIVGLSFLDDSHLTRDHHRVDVALTTLNKPKQENHDVFTSHSGGGDDIEALVPFALIDDAAGGGRERQYDTIAPLLLPSEDSGVTPPHADGEATQNNATRLKKAHYILAVLRRVLLFGDSLTAGAYYDDSTKDNAVGSKQLVFRTVAWSKSVQHTLRERFCSEYGHVVYGGGCRKGAAVPPIDVMAKGFPGKDSKTIHYKLTKMLRTSSASPTTQHLFSLVLTMTGTNDVMGLNHNLSESVKYIEAMHKVARSANCQRKGDGDVSPFCSTLRLEETDSTFSPRTANGKRLSSSLASRIVTTCCGSAVMLIPPLNLSLPQSWFGQKYPRGYCNGKVGDRDRIHQRAATLNQLLRSSPSLQRCVAVDWSRFDSQISFVRDQDNMRALWSDCLHPNADGYERFARIVAERLWSIAVDTAAVACGERTDGAAAAEVCV